jgi:hypothetical protein
MMKRSWRCIESLNDNLGIFKAALELIPVSKKDVFTMRL